MTEGLLAKKCNKCGEWKGHEHFHSRRAGCKVCEAEASRVRRDKKLFGPRLFKRCPCCTRSKPLGDFDNSAANTDGLRRFCRDCERALHDIRHTAEDKLTSIDKQLLGVVRKRRRASRDQLRNRVAVELCRSMGIDIDRLAKEKYDAQFTSEPQ